MEGTISPLEYREDCSSRSVATLLVAWMSAAMVASVLLRWKYMWIALAILTILFVIACGYAALSSNRDTEDAIEREESQFREQRLEIQSVSANMDENFSHRTEPPAYQTYWITDLPPPYTMVISSDPPPLLTQLNYSTEDESRIVTGVPRLSDPPPYLAAIQPNRTPTPSYSNYSQEVHTNIPTVPMTQLSRDISPLAPIHSNDIKEETDCSRASQNRLSTGTQYFSNFISHTFGRGQRSRNNERSSTAIGAVNVGTPLANQESISSSLQNGPTTS